jgi:hypothetical protein
LNKTIFILLALLTGTCFAQNSEIIEKSLTYDAKRQTRFVDGKVVVRQLVKSGAFKEKPTQRMDYADYYVPQKPVSVLGAKLISFEHQYQQKYIGCCVNPGNAVVLHPTKSVENIKSFADKNRCRFSAGREIFLVPDEALKGLSDKERLSLVEVSCKDDYLSDQDPGTN